MNEASDSKSFLFNAYGKKINESGTISRYFNAYKAAKENGAIFRSNVDAYAADIENRVNTVGRQFIVYMMLFVIMIMFPSLMKMDKYG